MCLATAVPIYNAVPETRKPINNIINNVPLGMAYKQASGGEKLSDSVKNGNIYAGLAGSALMSRMKNSNQFSIS